MTPEVPSLLADPPASNPLFGDRRLKMGTFCSNLKHGCAISSIEGTLEASWPATVALAELADRMEYEALVPVGRWRGFGGTTDFNGAGFECYSWAAGIAGVNGNSAIFATSHVPTVHPVMAAKQATTIDHISGGRFVLNVVTGWNESEFRLFGIDVPDHDRRYDMAVEWVEIIRRLWTEHELFDFEGEFYRIGGGQLLPKPIQSPRPPFMNAGGSERGRHFAAKYCDVAFIVVVNHDMDDLKAQIAAYKDLARKEYGREVAVWTHTYIVQGDTEKDARDFYEYYVHRARRLGGRDQPHRGARHQRPDRAARGARLPARALHRRLGGLAGDRHARADRRHLYRARRHRHRRRAHLLGALRGGNAGIRRRHLPADGRGGAQIGPGLDAGAPCMTSSYRVLSAPEGPGMRINARLDDDRAEKVKQLQASTRLGTSEILKRAIDLLHRQQTTRSRAQIDDLLSSDFVGCAEGPEDLASNCKRYLRESLEDEHGAG